MTEQLFKLAQAVTSKAAAATVGSRPEGMLMETDCEIVTCAALEFEPAVATAAATTDEAVDALRSADTAMVEVVVTETGANGGGRGGGDGGRGGIVSEVLPEMMRRPSSSADRRATFAKRFTPRLMAANVSVSLAGTSCHERSARACLQIVICCPGWAYW